jgi:hypothetical protein
VIRPFQFGDIVLIQRLGRQATKLNTIQSLLQPQSASWASLSALIPWNDAKVTTYVLNQQAHGLLGVGFLQVQKRPGRPELNIVRMAPGLDTPRGHPAIWEKLLSHHNAVAAQQHIARIYVDVPDQPLPVHTFGHVGFRAYTRQTIWRITAPGAISSSHAVAADIRPPTKLDEWPLQQLYARTVPEEVQIAEGQHTGQAIRPPILDWWLAGVCSSYVLERRGEIVGASQLVQGRRSYWLQLWADMLDPNTTVVHRLIRHALDVVWRRALPHPVYIGVRDYHGSLGSILSEYGFAPFTDRAKMVRHVVQWVREPALDTTPVVEVPASVAAAHYRLPAATPPAPSSAPLPVRAAAYPPAADLAPRGMLGHGESAARLRSPDAACLIHNTP